jgi:hypothetical protein
LFNQLIHTFNEAMGVKVPEVKSDVSDDSDHGGNKDVVIGPVGAPAPSGSVFTFKPVEGAVEDN